MGRLSPIEQLTSFATGDIQIGQQGKPKTAPALGMEAVGTGSLRHCWISPSLRGGEAVKKNARQTSAKDRLDQESPNTARGICSPRSSSASGPSLPIPPGDSQIRQHTHNPSTRLSLLGAASQAASAPSFTSKQLTRWLFSPSRPGTVLPERGTGLDAALGDGKVAAIHWGMGKRERARHCHQLTGWPRGIYRTSSQREGLRVLTSPLLQPSSPRPRLVLAACCPRHEPPRALGKGKTEFSKPQGQCLPASSRLLICSSICFCWCHLRCRGAGRWELETGARSNPCSPAAAPSASAPAGPASTAAPPGP